MLGAARYKQDDNRLKIEQVRQVIFSWIFPEFLKLRNFENIRRRLLQ